MYISNLIYGVSADKNYSSLFLELLDFKLNPRSTPQQRDKIVSHFSNFVMSNANPDRVFASALLFATSSRYIHAYKSSSKGLLLVTPLMVGSLYTSSDENQSYAIVHLNMSPSKPIQYLQELNQIISLEALPRSSLSQIQLEELLKEE